jgi:transposase
MRKAFKYRIYLTNGQRRILERQFEECRWLYNQTLALRKNAWEQEQMCSSCGTLVAKTLSDRTHTCPHCGLVIDRDRNAALNILHRGLYVLQS